VSHALHRVPEGGERPLALAAFRNRHQGDAIVVCGCGTSLKELTNPGQYITVGVNDVGRLFDPTYLVVVNPRTQFKNDRFRYVEQSNAQALFTQLDLGCVRPPVVRFKLGTYGGTEIDTDVLPHTQNSPYVAVCLAAYMGARQIGLIGVDLSDDHFFAQTGRHPLAGRVKEIDAQYGRLAAALQRRGISLVNLSGSSRLASLPKTTIAAFGELSPGLRTTPAGGGVGEGLRIVSYATTPLAGVPAILARCIAGATPHAARCVWAADGYGNGVRFHGDVQWNRTPRDAMALLEAADLVVVHNGKVAPSHARLLSAKPVITMAHNYGWNVDMGFVRGGQPGVVVGQYQATLPEFVGWTVVPNPIPLWEPAYQPGPKADQITIAFTPSGRHERYPPGHRLYWHGKGFTTTMRVLERLARRSAVRLETTAQHPVSHDQSLEMKRRAHIVIDECVTGSYHRNSLEGLAAGCVVVNGVGLLPGVVDALRRCAPDADRLPFVFASLDTLEEVLQRLVERGVGALEEAGRANRGWMERHWHFAGQWERFWTPAMAPLSPERHAAPVVLSHQSTIPRQQQEVTMPRAAPNAVTVIIPHRGCDRLRQLVTTLVTLRQRPGVGEVIVVEMGDTPTTEAVADRWADKHLFIKHAGAFERARALNAGEAVAECDFVLWHDNDLLIPPAFIPRSLKELCDRRLDYLIPYTSVRYLSELDSQAVMQGVRSPEDCRPENTFYSGRRTAACFGGIGLVRRDFLTRHGGYVEGFRGWGGEDNAWNRKVALLGRSAPTMCKDQHVHHLYHQASGGYHFGAASGSNPHYAENVALLRRVWSVREATRFVQQFPAVPPAAGTLTRSNGRARSRPGEGLPVWSYWEGPCPAWIRACRRTITAHAPRVRLLTPETFDRLRDRDRNIDLSGLCAPHRADYIRAFLLQRYGGLWIDADCLLMQPLQPLLDVLAVHDFIGHRERVGLISNAFIGARPGSRIASAFYDRVCHVLRARKPLYWNALGADPLTAVVAGDAQGWHELACEQVQPICWSHPEEFFAERVPADHERVFDARAICYMLSNGAINNYLAAHAHADLLRDRTFFSFLLRRSLGTDTGDQSSVYEAIFASHVELYRRQGCESLSGLGSCLAQTQELRERLPLLLEDLGVRTLLDAPCGDLNWMQHVHLGVDEYVGVDLLGEIIAENELRHASGQRRFVRADVIRGALPSADAILCRDLLGHLSFAEIFQALGNFKRTGATYLLATTFTGARPNHDTSAGEWRTINLTLPPFNLPEPLRLINEKCTEARGAFSDKSIGVWKLDDVPI